jgi:hypothetical protein
MRRVAPVVSLLLLSISAYASIRAADIPDDFPRFIVPGHQREMDALRALFWQHYQKPGPFCTIWDQWIPEAVLWPATSKRDQIANGWAHALLTRPIDDDGYVATQQHDGPAHAQGWPFPRWYDGGGAGWHFAPIGVAGYDAPRIAKPDEWRLDGATGGAVDPKTGWHTNPTAPRVVFTPPAINVDAPLHAPFLRLNWRGKGLAGATAYVEWTTSRDASFDVSRRIELPVPTDEAVETRTMIAAYRHPKWSGTITGLRIVLEHVPQGAGASVTIKSFHTAFDSRHNVNNFNFVSGCCDYVALTGDIDFVRRNISRMRRAMNALREFDIRRRKLVYTPWIGHDGRSGLTRNAAGEKTLRPGFGIGNNYWDLLPFGGEDALATVYCYAALNKLAALELAIAEHPEWNAPDDGAFDPADLTRLAYEIKAFAGGHFWNDITGRFGCAIDSDGYLHDVGATFLNTEAIYLGFATDAQAKSICDWLAGDRVVDGDTSTGADIYHWRFGPRSTTRRNLDYYVWGWSAPEAIPWGYQVQDGGAVLGWTYHDLMARLTTRGPDDAAARLRAIADWYIDVQSAGGYRLYYSADERRGTLQGGNKPGGIGVDMEFVESVLPPQVLIYGFLGLRPTPDGQGFTLHPRLPKDWPSLTITNIHVAGATIDVTATRERLIKIHGTIPAGTWRGEARRNGQLVAQSESAGGAGEHQMQFADADTVTVTHVR